MRHDRAHDVLGDRKILEHRGGSVTGQLFDRIVTCRYTDRSRSNRSPAIDVGRSVTNDDNMAALNVDPEFLESASLRDGG